MANQYSAPRFVDTVAQQAYCGKCKTIKPFSDFHKDSSSKYGITYWCKICANLGARFHHHRRMESDPNYKEYKKDIYIKSKYGLSLKEYSEKLKIQQNKCAICSVELGLNPNTHLDHCHKTGKIRGFLCTNCNRGLGHFQESVDIMKQAIEYIKLHESLNK